MDKGSSIFLAGHKGLVGSAVHKKLIGKGYKKIITLDKKKVDLRNYDNLLKYFKSIKIDYMIMAAARAGGIMANMTFQKDFFLKI